MATANSLILKDVGYVGSLRKSDRMPHSTKSLAQRSDSSRKMKDILVNNFLKKNMPPLKNPLDRKEIERQIKVQQIINDEVDKFLRIERSPTQKRLVELDR